MECTNDLTSKAQALPAKAAIQGSITDDILTE